MTLRPWPGSVAALGAALLLVLWAALCRGGTVPIRFTAPTLNEDGSTCTDLARFRVYGVFCRALGDTVVLGEIDGAGREGQDIQALVTVTNGPMGWLWVTAIDSTGNESGVRSWLTFAVPDSA